jgi:hypothetical protein
MAKSRPDEVPVSREITPHVLSREYEDYLDWRENQRHYRNQRPLKARLLRIASGILNAFAFAGLFLRRR